MELKELVGRGIKSFYLDPEGYELRLFLEDGKLAILTTYGDCCCLTWIESIDNEDALKGKITSIEKIEMPDLGNITTSEMNSVEFVQYYGLKIVTENGHCVIDYRNNSNGYYGGNLGLRITDETH